MSSVILWAVLLFPTQSCRDQVAKKREQAVAKLLEVSKSTSNVVGIEAARQELASVPTDPQTSANWFTEQPPKGAFGPCFDVYIGKVKAYRQ